MKLTFKVFVLSTVLTVALQASWIEIYTCDSNSVCTTKLVWVNDGK